MISDLCANYSIHELFVDRQRMFCQYITDFNQALDEGQIKYVLLDNKDVSNVAAYLSYHYLYLTFGYTKKHMVEPGGKINNYKIAAGTEFTIMRRPIYLGSSGELDLELNAKFANYCMSRLVFSWNSELNLDEVDRLYLENTPTRNFIEEHIAWLMLPWRWDQSLIFSNMQTIRLFYYWLRGTKRDDFDAH